MDDDKDFSETLADAYPWVLMYAALAVFLVLVVWWFMNDAATRERRCEVACQASEMRFGWTEDEACVCRDGSALRRIVVEVEDGASGGPRP